MGFKVCWKDAMAPSAVKPSTTTREEDKTKSL